MKTLTTTKILLATAFMACSAAAFAQASGTAGTPTPGMGTNQPVTGVGVTPQTAAEANRQAVPRSDTGTVVRTSPNATDSARNATGMTGSTTDTTGTGTTMRTARADRN